MPVYEFQCECGGSQEKLLPYSKRNTHVEKCEHCQKSMVRSAVSQIYNKAFPGSFQAERFADPPGHLY